MESKFICHSDFESAVPINVFHKEHGGERVPPCDDRFKNRHILFRNRFSVSEHDSAVIRMTADDYFRLYINGRFVMQGPPPSYPNAYRYMEKDVSEYLRDGENVIAVHTYYQGLINRVWVSGDMRESFWCELDVDGETVLVSDESWKCAEHSAYFSCGTYGYETAFAECYDSSSAETGFERTDYDDSSWDFAKVYKNADYNLVKSTIEPLDMYTVTPQIIAENGESIFVDMGREYVGRLRMKAVGKKGDCVLMHFGEETDDSGKVRYEMRCNCKYEEKLLLSGDIDLLDEFEYKAFRYVEIVLPKDARVYDIEMVVQHYPYNRKTELRTGNEKLDKVLELCEDTIHYGVQEVFVDCPTREKGQYLGDVFISGRAQAILTGDTVMLKKAIQDFFDSSFICKGLMAVSTSAHMQEIADYSLLISELTLWAYKRDGDISFLKNAYPYLNGVFEYFKAYDSGDGLIENVHEKWNLVDWPDNLRDGYDFPLTNPIGKGLHNVINAFWYGFVKAYDEISEILGYEKTGMTEIIAKSFIRAFYDENSGLFCDSTEKRHSAVHSNVLPLYFGIMKNNDAFVKNAVQLIHDKKLTSMGVYMSYFAIEALCKNNADDIALELATDDGAWLNMISEGGTTTFEAWGKEQKWNTSLFHPWATAPIIVFEKMYQE